MSKKTLFVITSKSELERWDISQQKLSLNENIVNVLIKGTYRRQSNVMPIQLIDPGSTLNDSDNAVGIAIGDGGYTVMRARITKLNIRAPFAVDDNVIYPVFDGKYPILHMEWHVPATMRLFLCVHFPDGHGRSICDQNLVAIDADNKMWKLPISNLSDDCKLCLGRYSTQGYNMLDLFKSAWNQFNTSDWNADLYNITPDLRNNTKEMFSYGISNDKFTQLPISSLLDPKVLSSPKKTWQNLCTRVSTVFLEAAVNYV